MKLSEIHRAKPNEIDGQAVSITGVVNISDVFSYISDEEDSSQVKNAILIIDPALCELFSNASIPMIVGRSVLYQARGRITGTLNKIHGLPFFQYSLTSISEIDVRSQGLQFKWIKGITELNA